MSIERARGDESPIRVTWDLGHGCADLSSATAMSLAVYDSDRLTLVETLVGEVRGFDPATYFPIIDADWSGTRYARVIITQGAEDKPLKQYISWTQS